MNYARDIIEERLNTRERKQLTFNIDSGLIDKMDKVSEIFNDINKRNYPRNDLLEDAIDAYLTEIDSFLKENYGITIDGYKGDYEPDKYKSGVVDNFDTVVYPGYKDGFNEAFLGEHRWYYVRIRKENIDKIKYVAIYVGRPVSGITYYAKVKKYIPSRRYPNKYLIELDGEPILLPKKIELGDLSAASLRAPKYTTLEKLLQAKTVADL